jgi:transcriptional regulator with XRE-family HTH domain
MENRGYNISHSIERARVPMPKQNFDELPDFGKRLVNLRKSAGYTQVELAKELEVSQRMVSHYESQAEFPPSALLPKLSKVLGVTADELLGIKQLKKHTKPDSRLQRRMQQVEKMNTANKRQIMQLLDTFIEREQLKKEVSQ